jgi:ubiquinone/menaquinone biosynthesis C-methylase UbiE
MSQDSLDSSPLQPDWLKPDQIPIAIQDVQQKYDAISDSYDTYVQNADYQAPKAIAPLLQGFLAEHQQITLHLDYPILDAGCGTGVIGSALATAGFNTIYGFDLSSKSLDIARQKSVYTDLVQANLLEPLPYDSKQFSATFCIGVFSRFTSTQILAILSEFSRITQPQGLIVFSHRSDLIRDTDLINLLSQSSLFTPKHITKPLPYLPNLIEYQGIDIQYIFLQNHLSELS